VAGDVPGGGVDVEEGVAVVVEAEFGEEGGLLRWEGEVGAEEEFVEVRAGVGLEDGSGGEGWGGDRDGGGEGGGGEEEGGEEGEELHGGCLVA